MSTIFSKIIKGEIPSYKVAEDDSFYAFLDINPVQPGHTLVVPKREEDDFFALAPEELSEMIVFAQRVARAIREVVHCRKVAVAVIGLEVNHAHMHLVPITNEGDLDFSKKKQLPPEKMEWLSREIAARLN